MFDRLFKNSKIRGRNLIICILPFVLLIGLFVLLAYNSVADIVPVSNNETVVDEDVDAGDYHYVLRDDATDLQKDLFDEFSKSIETNDDVRTAELCAMNFVADFYTWTNKVGSYDVGGIYFVNGSQRKSIILKARMGFYKYLTYYINTYGSDSLIEVKDIRVLESSKQDEKYEFDGKQYDSFYVKLEWDYNNYSFDEETDFMNKGYFTVVKRDNGRFEIFDAWGDE